MKEWISINDKLPKKDEVVLCFTRNDEFIFGILYNEEEKSFYNINSEYKEYVTHWCYLVSPGEKKGN